MKVEIFASGSSGNCLLVSDSQTRILVDVGITFKKLQIALLNTDIRAEDIDGVLITHEHSDHVCGLPVLVNKLGVPVYAPRTVYHRLIGTFPKLEDSIAIIPVGEEFVVGTVYVTAFHTPHDTDESVGYRFTGEGSFAVATDMGHVTEEILRGLCGVDAALIESNHDIDMLRYGRYPVSLKRRVLSDHGHLSNADCAVLARTLAQTGTKQIILGHLSAENNRPDLALQESTTALNGLAELYCAPRSGYLKIETGACVKC